MWAALFIFATTAIFLEQRFKWAERISGPVIGLILAIIAVNLRILPTDSAVYDAVWTYFIPLAVAMLLFRADIKTIVRNTGKMFFLVNVASLGTLIGVIVAFFIFRGKIPELDKVAGVITGSYIGGGVNLFAVASSVNISQTMLSAEIVADNFIMALVIFLTLWMPTSAFFRRRYPHPIEDELAKRGAGGKNATMTAQFWGRKEISLLDIALTVGTAFLIVVAATKCSGLLGKALAPGEGAGFWQGLPSLIFGNQYVMLTIVSTFAVSLFPKYFAALKGAQEVGTYLIYVFFVVIGCPASIKDVLLNAPFLFLFCGIIATMNIILNLLAGKLFRHNLEEICLTSNASIGGPSTAAAMAVAKGYDKLVVPGILIGLWGYIIGTPLGLIMSRWFEQFMK